mgnify:CR=1 FL=1
MKIIINTSLMVPIYEQIVDQIKMLIRNGELKENDNLPSVRTLSKELKISALTVKKAYDNLESEGFTVTVHGKGTYVAATNTELLLEEQKKELEADLEQAIQKGRRCGISDEDIKSLFELILEGWCMLKIEHLKKHYENFSLDCSLELMSGCVTGLIGQNGAGKSTTFKAILGLISPDGGNITILGKDRKDFTAKDKEELGVVLSDSGFSGYLKIKDIIPILQNMYSKFDKSLFIEQAQKFQLPMNKQIKEFSTGMKVKLKVLVAISHNAKLLILDEPTAGLDVIARDELLEMLREFLEKDEERSILISSHISSDLQSLCDDLYMIHQGKVIMHEDTDVLLSDYALLKVDEEEYSKLDRQYILRTKKESYGYSCLTNQKQYYAENYPQMAIEKGNIDEVITMMIRGVE